MLAGFVHGVPQHQQHEHQWGKLRLRPYRFLPRNDPNFVAAYFDEKRPLFIRAASLRSAVFWNLRQFGGTLTLVTAQDALVGP